MKRTRRAVLRDGTMVAIAVLGGGSVAFAAPASGRAFLTEEEMETLRALVDVFIPGDADPGAVAAECAEGIDALLGAFETDPPRIYAGAPFSDRAGSPVNHFATFLTLDAYEERAWRLRIEGSRGDAALERNGTVLGWQVVYREGLGALAAAGFAGRPQAARELHLRTTSNPAVKALVDVAWPHTWELMYGAPEYGGNKDLAGWGFTRWDGDVQPRGWSKEEVEGPPEGTGLDDLPLPLDELLGLAALAGSSESAHVLIGRTDGSLRKLRQELAPVRKHLRAKGGRRAR